MSQRFNPPYDPTRYPMGVGTANNVEVLGDFGMPDPTKYHTRFDDFNFVANWTATTTAVVDGAGGLATITAAGSLESAASWQFDAGLRQFLKCRAAAAGATAVGLVGFVDDAEDPTDGVWVDFVNGLFTLHVADSTISYQRDFSAAEFVTFGIVHDPRSMRVVLYVDNQAVASLPDATMNTTDPLILAATATTANVTLDYILAAFER